MFIKNRENKKTMFLKNIIILLLSCFFFISFTSAGIMINEGGNHGVIIELPELPVFNNATAFVNMSDYWVTDEGILDNVADITYDDISGGDVNALGYTGFFSWSN